LATFSPYIGNWGCSCAISSPSSGKVQVNTRRRVALAFVLAVA
jgi:hypothetical protein